MVGWTDRQTVGSSTVDQFSSRKIREENRPRGEGRRRRGRRIGSGSDINGTAANRWRRAMKHKIFHISPRIYIRAIKRISRSGPLMEALKQPRHIGTTTIRRSVAAVATRDHHRHRAVCIHTTKVVYRASTRTRANVSTCLPITDCSDVVDIEGGRSFSFGRLHPASPPFPPAAVRTSPSLQAATPIPILLLHTRRSQSSPSLSPPPPIASRCDPPRLSSSSSFHPFISLSSTPARSPSLFRSRRLPAFQPKGEVYKFARRNCHEKYGILSASKATLVAWETSSGAKGVGETKRLAGLQRRFRGTSLARSRGEDTRPVVVVGEGRRF